MDTLSPPVVVPNEALRDLCDLALIAADRLGEGEPGDALARNLRGAVANIRITAVPDPT